MDQLTQEKWDKAAHGLRSLWARPGKTLGAL